MKPTLEGGTSQLCYITKYAHLSEIKRHMRKKLLDLACSHLSSVPHFSVIYGLTFS